MLFVHWEVVGLGSVVCMCLGGVGRMADLTRLRLRRVYEYRFDFIFCNVPVRVPVDDELDVSVRDATSQVY
jgi:hypothetical protein